MKISANLSLVLSICLLVSTCAKNENQDESAKLGNVLPILEISQEAKGIWDVTGKTLFFQLYNNGFVEFEKPDENKKISGKINKAEEITVLKQTKITEEEFQKITSLLAVEDFQKVQDTYQRKCCCTDATLDYKIRFKINNNYKNIFLSNYCDLGELTNPQTHNSPEIPKVLPELMSSVSNARWKYFSK